MKATYKVPDVIWDLMELKYLKNKIMMDRTKCIFKSNSVITRDLCFKRAEFIILAI